MKRAQRGGQLFVWILAILSALAWQSPWSLAQENLAFGRPVEAPGVLWEGLGPETLTDGRADTFTHPRAATGNEGFHFQVDLGASVPLQRIVVRHRQDACCPDRLARYRLELYEDGPDGDEVGILNWVAVIRSGEVLPRPGDADVITAAHARFGVFGGRYVRLVNESEVAYSPQVAEIEAYGGAAPKIISFTVDADHLRRGESTVLRWETVGAISGALAPAFDTVSLPAGSLEVHPVASTTYTLTVTNGHGAASAEVQVGVDVTLAPPVLTEFGAAADREVVDEEGEATDWIEIHNPNPYSLDLSGYGLSDDPDIPAKWILPATRVPPGGYQLVFASGKDRRAGAGPWHTSFRLDAGGDTLLLTEPVTGRLVSAYPSDGRSRFPAQVEGVGYGLGTNAVVGYLRPATPGAANGAAVAGLVAAVEASVAGGFREGPVEVVLRTDTPGAVIRYTLDRSEPTATRGQAYGAPVRIAQGAVLRAAAFREGWEPSAVVTHTHIFPDQLLASSVMRRSITTNAQYAPQLRAALADLPNLSLVTAVAISDVSETAGSLEWLDPLGGAGFRVGCGARRFGGAFTDFAKKSFRLYFKREYGPGKLRFPVFGNQGAEFGVPPVEEFDQLELRSGSHDMEMRGFYLSNPYTDDTLLEMGQLSAHGRFVHLHLNGTYWGVYHLRERWGGAMHASYRGGDQSEYESINGNWNVGGWAEPGTAYDGTGAVWTRVKSLRGDYAGVRTWLDVPHYLDFMLVWLFGGSEDEYRCVGSVARGNGFQFLINDADGWFCVPSYCAAGNRTGRDAPGRRGGDGPGSLFSMLFAGGDPDYRALLADRIHDALRPGGALSPERTAARLANRVREFERPFLLESARWGYLTPSAWRQRRDSVESSWLPARSAAFLAELKGAGFAPRLEAPTFVPGAGRVARGTKVRFGAAAGATVYYTLDGSDPRLPGGAVSPSAHAFRVGGNRETVLPAGARWRWFTSPAGLGASDVVEGSAAWSASEWKHPAFDDAGWSEGPAELGYGDNDEATVLPYGGVASAKWIAAYFRRRVTVRDPTSVTTIRCRVRRDDGVILYWNGREVARSGFGPGRVTATTLATAADDDGRDWQEFTWEPRGTLSEGNLLAAEVHQSSAASSDTSFDLELEVERTGGGEGTAPELTANSVIRGRAWQAGTWSAVESAFYGVDPEPGAGAGLVVSELNFDPAGLDGSEFLELENRSAVALNLRGVRFSEGVQFGFREDRDVPLAAGARVLLVRDAIRFRARYGLEPVMAGRYRGQLANEGETLSLVDGAERAWLRLRYGVRSPWPVEASDGGRSLVWWGGVTQASDDQWWLPSAALGGTPGMAESPDVVPGGVAGADQDEDGYPAVVEAAMLSSDTDAGRQPRLAGFERVGSGRVSLWTRRRLGFPGLRVQAEASADLKSWIRLTREAVVSEADGVVRETWSVPVVEGAAVVARVSVVQER